VSGQLFDQDDEAGDQSAGAGSSARAEGRSRVPLSRQPLAARMRPRTIEEYVGQPEALGPGSPLRRALEAGRLPTSLLLWGPPGTGKTSLAHVVSQAVDAVRVEMSAVTAGVKDVRRVVDAGERRLELSGRRTLLFLDEIHRFTKAQQDALLPGVEAGWVVLVGATTENPFFELNAPLLSRCRLVRLEPLTDDDLRTVLDRTLADERGYGGRLAVTDEAREHLLHLADGDARALLTTLEVAAEAVLDLWAADPADAPAADADTDPNADPDAAPGADTDPGAAPDEDTHAHAPVVLDVEQVDVAQKRHRYDKGGDQHYDQVSAFIKSLRGSDPDAALYWLFRMLAGGEDPRFLARRMVILASEDIGLADRLALPTAIAAFEALDRVGLPEAEFALAHVAIALATAPKSNSVTTAIASAKRAVADRGDLPVPAHLRDGHYKGARKIGHGVGYEYPHDAAQGHVEQQYLPDGMRDVRLYEPGPHGHEAGIAQRLAAWWPDRYPQPDDSND